MTSRDEILQTFQAVTGLDDIGVCMSILEQFDWNLETAVNNFMPQDIFSSGPSPPLPPSQPSTSKITDTRNSLIDLTNDDVDGGTTTPLAASADLLKLNVTYNETKHTVSLPLTSTIKELKQKLKELTGLACSNQRITGLPDKVTDETQFYDKKYDGLKSSSLLILQPIVEPPIWEQCIIPDTLPPTQLRKRSEEEEGEASQDEEASLEDDNDDSEEGEGGGGGYERMTSEVTEGAGSDDEDQGDDGNEGFDEDMFLDPGVESYESRAPLIPEGCDDPVEALQFFTSCFTARYGEPHPLFYIGSLSDAVKEATGVPADERRPLFIYLHHDKSILSNIFCSQLLCIDSIVDYLTNYYVVWAWDLTKESLKRKLLDMVKESFGVSVATHVDDIKPDSLPVILVVYKSKGQIEVRDIIQGSTDPDKLLTTLISAYEQHQLLTSEDLKDEQERKAREDMIRAQEQAYQDSLLADKEKEKQRQQEEDYRLQKEREEQIERMKREEERQHMLSSIPPEPDQSCTDKVSSIRIRLPDGTTDQRRFLASAHTVRMLINYVGSKGYPPSEYKMLTSYPKRNITELDLDQSLLEAKLYPTETLHVEDDS